MLELIPGHHSPKLAAADAAASGRDLQPHDAGVSVA